MKHQAITHYSAPALVLHWLTAILVLIAFIYGLGGPEDRVHTATRDFDRQLHETIGISVLALVALRIFWRALDKRPPRPDVVHRMETLAKVVQVTPCVLLFGVLESMLPQWIARKS